MELGVCVATVASTARVLLLMARGAATAGSASTEGVMKPANTSRPALALVAWTATLARRNRFNFSCDAVGTDADAPGLDNVGGTDDDAVFASFFIFRCKTRTMVGWDARYTTRTGLKLRLEPRLYGRRWTW